MDCLTLETTIKSRSLIKSHVLLFFFSYCLLTPFNSGEHFNIYESRNHLERMNLKLIE